MHTKSVHRPNTAVQRRTQGDLACCGCLHDDLRLIVIATCLAQHLFLEQLLVEGTFFELLQPFVLEEHNGSAPGLRQRVDLVYNAPEEVGDARLNAHALITLVEHEIALPKE